MNFSKIGTAGLALIASTLGGCGMYTAHYTGTETAPGLGGGGSGAGSYQVTMTLVDQGNGKVKGTYGSNSPLFQAGSVEANVSGDTLSNFTVSMFGSAAGGSGCTFTGNITSNGADRKTLSGQLVGSGTSCTGQIKTLNLNKVQ